MSRILILGEAPGGKTSGGLTRRRLTDLAGCPWDEWADWRNLLDEWPGRAGKGSAWNARAAAAAAAELYASGVLADYDVVVLLGRRVAGAMIPGGAGFPFFRSVERAGTTLAVMPHTSGIVRWWNDPGNERAARVFVRSLLATYPNPKEDDTMSAIEPAKPDPKHTTTKKPAAAKPAKAKATPKAAAAKPVEKAAASEPATAEIHETLLGRIREVAEKPVESVEKKGYVRLTLGGKTLAFVGHPGRSLKVEVPRDTGGGYEVFRVKSRGEIAPVVSAVKKRVKAMTSADA